MENLTAKMLIVGDGMCGKSSLKCRLVQNGFDEDYKITIGVDFGRYSITFNGYNITLVLWDVGGQKQFASMRSAYYVGARVAILMFDVTRRETFDTVEDWIMEIKQFCGDIPLVLCGNKIDLVNWRQVDTDEIEKMALKWGIPFFEISVKDKINLDNALNEACGFLIPKEPEPEPEQEPSSDVQLDSSGAPMTFRRESFNHFSTFFNFDAFLQLEKSFFSSEENGSILNSSKYFLHVF